MSDWISVEDRLPEEDSVVDLWIKSKERKDYGRRATSQTYLKHDGFRFMSVAGVEYISHWMPLPEPPK